MGADMIAHVLDGAMDRSVLVERAMRPQLVIVGGILARIAERYPRLEFRVVESDAGTLCRLLRERKIDLAVCRPPEAMD